MSFHSLNRSQPHGRAIYWSLVTRQPTNIFLTPNQLYTMQRFVLKYLNFKKTYIYLEAVCPRFLGLQPSKTHRLPRWFGFQFIYNLKNIHIYTYIYYTELADFLFYLSWLLNLPHPQTQLPSWEIRDDQSFFNPTFLRETNQRWLNKPLIRQGGWGGILGAGRLTQPMIFSNLVKTPKTLFTWCWTYENSSTMSFSGWETKQVVARSPPEASPNLRILFEQDTIFGEGNQLFLRRFCLGGCGWRIRKGRQVTSDWPQKPT